jgi:hypothetical protein
MGAGGEENRGSVWGRGMEATREVSQRPGSTAAAGTEEADDGWNWAVLGRKGRAGPGALVSQREKKMKRIYLTGWAAKGRGVKMRFGLSRKVERAFQIFWLQN